MGIYFVALLVVILLAAVVLVVVALAHTTRTGRAGARLSGQFEALMHHLNGEAKAPRLLEAMLSRSLQVPGMAAGGPSTGESADREYPGARDRAA